jgi:hypothetical protein
VAANAAVGCEWRESPASAGRHCLCGDPLRWYLPVGNAHRPSIQQRPHNSRSLVLLLCCTGSRSGCEWAVAANGDRARSLPRGENKEGETTCRFRFPHDKTTICQARLRTNVRRTQQCARACVCVCVCVCVFCPGVLYPADGMQPLR